MVLVCQAPYQFLLLWRHLSNGDQDILLTAPYLAHPILDLRLHLRYHRQDTGNFF